LSAEERAQAEDERLRVSEGSETSKEGKAHLVFPVDRSAAIERLKQSVHIAKTGEGENQVHLAGA